MRVPLNVGDFLRRAAQVYPGSPAVVDEPGSPGSWGTVTYGQLEARARGMALALEEMGVGVGERVAIVSPNSARFQAAFFGVSAYGRILVPINYRLNAEEIGYIVEHSGASVLLVDPASDGVLAAVRAPRRIVLDGSADAALFAEASAGSHPRAWDGGEDDVASINYTSGTTARPKGVQLTHRNCWLNAVTLGWHMGVQEQDVFMHTLPMFHCNGWGMPYAVTAMGCKQVIVRRIDGEEILDRMEEHEVTLLCGAPAVVNAILQAADVRAAEARYVPGRSVVRMVVAGAPPPTRTIERVEVDLGWEFIQIYGLTETAPLLTLNRAPVFWDDNPPFERARMQARAGVPALGVGIRTASDGEILARSNHVFAGYWQQPEETAEALAGGWFHTGDKGFIDADGYLVVADRKKDVIITGGENVSSLEVEDCLYEHPGVAEVAVIGVPHEKWGETVKALVVRRPGEDPDAAELIAHCRERLAHFKCPTSVDFFDSLPRTATGKLQKFKLRELYRDPFAPRPY